MSKNKKILCERKKLIIYDNYHIIVNYFNRKNIIKTSGILEHFMSGMNLIVIFL